jgi:hypothetical protein
MLTGAVDNTTRSQIPPRSHPSPALGSWIHRRLVIEVTGDTAKVEACSGALNFWLDQRDEDSGVNWPSDRVAIQASITERVFKNYGRSAVRSSRPARPYRDPN